MKTLGYTTKQGDTLFHIAVLFYVRWDLWPIIYFANREAFGEDPHTVTSGVRIQVPIPPVADTEYVIENGDTSVSIAEKVYGAKELFYLVDEACAHALRPAGSVIRLPALLSQLELDAALDIRRELNVF